MRKQLDVADRSTTTAAFSSGSGLDRTWILDSGSCVDLVRKSDLTYAEKRRIREAREPERLLTANGPAQADTEVSCGSLAQALVMEDSPSVLSLGKLVQEKGFSFEWKAGCRPLLTNSAGQEITVDVHDNVPTIASPVISCPVPGTDVEKSSGSNVVPDTVGRERSLAEREETECIPCRNRGLDPNH